MYPVLEQLAQFQKDDRMQALHYLISMANKRGSNDLHENDAKTWFESVVFFFLYGQTVLIQI